MIVKDNSFSLRQQLLREINLSIVIDESLTEMETSWSHVMEQPIPLQEHFLSWDLHHLLERVNQECTNELQEIAKIQMGEQSSYYATLKAIDEMICSIASVGGDPQQIEILAHFCQLHDCRVLADKQQMQQLLCAVAGLADAAATFELPLKYSHQPFVQPELLNCWLLISAISFSNNMRIKNLKARGDWVYIVGLTKNELGRSEYALMKEISGGIFPKTNLSGSKNVCQKIHQAIQKKIVSSCHSCNKGGLAVALVKMASCGVIHGIKVDLNTVPIENVHSDTELLFSESSSRFVVTVPPSLAREFEESISTHPFGRIGVATEDNEIAVTGLHGDIIIRLTDMFKFTEVVMR